MKKILFFFIFIASIAAKAQTVVYHPFPDSNAVWIAQWGCCQPGGGPGCTITCCTITNWYEMTGDSILNGRTYHKIESLGTYSCNPPFCSPCGLPDWGIRLIREDSTKRIWIWDTFSMADTLLYDFNLSVGDTINTLYSNDIGSPHIVQSIDSIFIGIDYRKIYYYGSNLGNDSCTQFLIEGIGTGAGLFSPLCGNGCFEQGFQLSCFKQDGNILYYPNPSICTVD
ncbi:MAG: hypothetical protein JJE25_02970, partial [Bacteroidia bacterium]|nr:hypothetical protein [Bacteroidia bacterium]